MNGAEDSNKTVEAVSTIEEALMKMKFDDSKAYLSALEKILDLNNGPVNTSTEQHITDILRRHLENYSSDDIYDIFQEVENLLSSKELEKITAESVPVEQIEELDNGCFGTIHLGELRKPDGLKRKVAVKVLKDEESQWTYDMLFDEAKMMARLKHRNVVEILAFQKEPLKIVMEYMGLGSLEQAVRDVGFSGRELLEALHDVASGLEYMARKRYVHRDLACKNVLVDDDKVCKLGDFGLSRYFGPCVDGEYEETERLILIASAPPEAQETELYSMKTDVWAFGVLICELYTRVDEPDTFSYNGYISTVEDYPSTGILPRGKLFPENLYDYVIEKVMNRDSELRPDFTAIKEKIAETLLVFEEQPHTSNWSACRLI